MPLPCWKRLGLALATLLLATPALAASSPPELVALVHQPAGGAAGRPLYVALHGLGSDEHDLWTLAPLLPQDAVLASLRAPIRLLPGHYAWFHSRAVAGCPLPDPAELQRSVQAVQHRIAELVARYHVDPRRIVVFGFSQGAIMSHALALAAPGRYEGIAALSGAWPLAAAAVQPAAGLQVFIAHGLADPRIAPACARAAADAWRARGAGVELHLYPGLEHQLSAAELADFRHWLQRR